MDIGIIDRRIVELGREANRVQGKTLVQQDVEILTLKLTALIAGLNTTRTVESWLQRSDAIIPTDKEERLRGAYIVSELLKPYYSDRIIRQWFVGRNRSLRTSPALALRSRRFDEVIEAAKEFLAG